MKMKSTHTPASHCKYIRVHYCCWTLCACVQLGRKCMITLYKPTGNMYLHTIYMWDIDPAARVECSATGLLQWGDLSYDYNPALVHLLGVKTPRQASNVRAMLGTHTGTHFHWHCTLSLSLSTSVSVLFWLWFHFCCPLFGAHHESYA